MRSVLLITGLLMAVALAFVMGVFVGVRHDGVQRDSSSVAGAATGDQASTTTGGSASSKAANEPQDKNAQGQDAPMSGDSKAASKAGRETRGGTPGDASGGSASATGSLGDASSADAATGSAADSSPDTQSGDGGDGGGKQTATWFSEAVPAPGDRNAVTDGAMRGGSVAGGKAEGKPTVLTASQTQPGAPVYAVQTVHAVPRERAKGLARELSGGRATARVLPAFDGDAGTTNGNRVERAHVRLGAFAEREAAAGVADRAMRARDVRLRVVRVQRPAGPAGQADDGFGRGSESGAPSGGS